MQHRKYYLLLRTAIAFIWLWTAITVLVLAPIEESLALLPGAFDPAGFGAWLVRGTALFELFLGLATLVGWRVRLWAVVQLGLVLAFTLIITVFLPGQWLHPFGPVSKNIPLLAATAVLYHWEGEQP